MKGMAILGIVLLLGGLAALIWPAITVTRTEKAAGAKLALAEEFAQFHCGFEMEGYGISHSSPGRKAGRFGTSTS